VGEAVEAGVVGEAVEAVGEVEVRHQIVIVVVIVIVIMTVIHHQKGG
jgi:hypothetical protein